MHDVVEWQPLLLTVAAILVLMLAARAAITSAVDCCHMVQELSLKQQKFHQTTATAQILKVLQYSRVLVHT